MTMSYSYKPVFMLAFLDNMNDAGEARLEDVARSFAAFYEDRRAHGLPAEKKNCIFTKGGYSQKDVERLILSMPFKRYEDMHIMHHSKHLGTLQFYKTLVRQLTDEDYAAIRESCHQAIDRYATGCLGKQIPPNSHRRTLHIIRSGFGQTDRSKHGYMDAWNK